MPTLKILIFRHFCGLVLILVALSTGWVCPDFGVACTPAALAACPMKIAGARATVARNRSTFRCYQAISALSSSAATRATGCSSVCRPSSRKRTKLSTSISGSSDGSPAAAESEGFIVVRLDGALPFTAARARNEGYVAATLKWPCLRYVQFIDGDCELVAGWLDKAYAFMEAHQGVAVVCGRRRERFPEQSIYNRLCDLEWATPVGEAIACGGDSFVRTSAFDTAGGFQPKLIAGEEPEMCLRIREQGWKIWRIDAEMTIHDAAMNRFSQWWIRAVRGGYGYAEVAQLHRNSSFSLWGKEIRSAIIWTASLPLIIISGSLFNPLFYCLLLIYPLQICRMASRRNIAEKLSWLSSCFILFSQFAAFLGILKFYWSRLRHKQQRIIEYKGA